MTIQFLIILLLKNMAEPVLYYDPHLDTTKKDGLMGRRVTLEDIARQSGVSLATVSLVLRDKPGINTKTRRRVLDTARELGYRRKPTSEAPLLEGLQQVGVIMRSRAGDLPQTNQFYAPVLVGIEAA